MSELTGFPELSVLRVSTWLSELNSLSDLTWLVG